MAVGKTKPVRWTIPAVKDAPARALEARPVSTRRGAAYPSVTELVAGGRYTRGWLEGALRSVLAPVAVASAVSLGASGCVDVAGLLAGDAGAASVQTDSASGPPATLTPLPSLGAGGGSFSGSATTGTAPFPPSKPPVAFSSGGQGPEPCPLPPLVQGDGPSNAHPAAHPPNARGGRRVIRPLPVRPPVPPPDPNPPTVLGEVAAVRPVPPPMPGGLRVVAPSQDGGS